MNPNMVARNRTARLAAQGVPAAYTSETKPREHLSVVEMDSGIGRYWSKPMPESKVNDYISRTPDSYSVSDIDHAAKCWCFDN